MTRGFPGYFLDFALQFSHEKTMDNGVSSTSRADIFEMRDPIGIKFIGDLDIAQYYLNFKFETIRITQNKVAHF